MEDIFLPQLNQLAHVIHQRNVDKGFYSEPVAPPTSIALMHSELSEALEADRKGNYANLTPTVLEALKMSSEFSADFKEYAKDTFEDELADVLIRVLDYAGYRGIDIANHVALKLHYNAQRTHKHGNKKY